MLVLSALAPPSIIVLVQPPTQLEECDMRTPGNDHLNLEQQSLEAVLQTREARTTHLAPGTPAAAKLPQFWRSSANLTKAYLGLIVRQLALSATGPLPPNSNDGPERSDRLTHRSPDRK